MDKEEVLQKIELYKGRPIEIFCDNSIHMYIGIDGHWVFQDDKGLCEIRKNTVSTTPGIVGMTQQESPYTITYTDFEQIQYIKGYLQPSASKIESIVKNLKPIGTDKSIGDIIKEITSDRIVISSSPIGYLNSENVTTDSYGQFAGTAISTTNQGIPANIKRLAGIKED